MHKDPILQTVHDARHNIPWDPQMPSLKVLGNGAFDPPHTLARPHYALHSSSTE